MLAVWAGSADDALYYSGHIMTLAANGKRQRLVTRSVRDLAPDWPPRGGRIVFLRARPGGSSPSWATSLWRPLGVADSLRFAA